MLQLSRNEKAALGELRAAMLVGGDTSGCCSYECWLLPDLPCQPLSDALSAARTKCTRMSASAVVLRKAELLLELRTTLANSRWDRLAAVVEAITAYEDLASSAEGQSAIAKASFLRQVAQCKLELISAIESVDELNLERQLAQAKQLNIDNLLSCSVCEDMLPFVQVAHRSDCGMPYRRNTCNACN